MRLINSVLFIFVIFFIPFFLSPVLEPGHGLHHHVYNSRDIDEEVLLNRITPGITLLSEAEKEVLGNKSGYFQRFSGFILIPSSGSYRFFLTNHGDVSMFLDGRSVFSEGEKYQGLTHGFTLNLTKGWHKLTIEATRKGELIALKLWWKPPFSHRQQIPLHYFIPDENSLNRVMASAHSWMIWSQLVLVFVWLSVQLYMERTLRPGVHMGILFSGIALLLIFLETIWFSGGFSLYLKTIALHYSSVLSAGISLGALLLYPLISGILKNRTFLHSRLMSFLVRCNELKIPLFLLSFSLILILPVLFLKSKERESGLLWRCELNRSARSDVSVVQTIADEPKIPDYFRELYQRNPIKTNISTTFTFPGSGSYILRAKRVAFGDILLNETPIAVDKPFSYVAGDGPLTFQVEFLTTPENVIDERLFFWQRIEDVGKNTFEDIDVIYFPDRVSLSDKPGVCLSFVSLFLVFAGVLLLVTSSVLLVLKVIRNIQHYWFLGLVLVLLLAILPRLVILQNEYWRLNSDEAVNGLMARDILENRGHPPSFNPHNHDITLSGRAVFFYGQGYHGTLSAHLMAFLASLIPKMSLIIKVVPMLFFMLFVLVLAFLLRSVTDEKTSLLTTLIIAISPSYLFDMSMQSAGNYMEMLFIGVLIFHLVVRLPLSKSPGLLLTLVGFFCGLGLWLNQLVIFFIITSGMMMLQPSRRHFLKRGYSSIAGFIVGYYPVLLWDFSHGGSGTWFVEAMSVPDGGLHPWLLAKWSFLQYIVRDVVPLLLGAKASWLSFQYPKSIQWVYFILICVLVITFLIKVSPSFFRFIFFRDDQNKSLSFVLFFTFLVILGVTVSRYSREMELPRYFSVLWPGILIIVGYSISSFLSHRQKIVRFGGFAVTIFLIIYLCVYLGISLSDARQSHSYYKTFVQLIETVSSDHVTGQYWDAYRAVIATDERLLIAQTVGGARFWRYPFFETVMLSGSRLERTYIIPIHSGIRKIFDEYVRRNGYQYIDFGRRIYFPRGKQLKKTPKDLKFAQ